jgi:hypothetical protein
VEKWGSHRPGKAATSLLPANDYVLAVVGKAADISPLPAKHGTWEEEKITSPLY